MLKSYIETLEDFDFHLIFMEDEFHGESGELITKTRVALSKLLENLRRLSDADIKVSNNRYYVLLTEEEAIKCIKYDWFKVDTLCVKGSYLLPMRRVMELHTIFLKSN